MTDHTVLATGALQGERLNRVVRNTFTLLSLVLAVAAVGSGVGLAMNVGWSMGMWVLFMVAFIGGPFAINAMKGGQGAILMTFAWAGLIGFLFSGVIGAYLRIPGGGAIVFNALATTTVLFASLSAYAVVSRKDFSFMGGFLMAGLIVALVAIVANLFLQIPLLSLAISGVVVLLMCGLILFETSRLIHDGNANPVFIVVSLFSSFVVLFSHLLNLFALLSGDD